MLILLFIISTICSLLNIVSQISIMQPDSPAELGNKIYEMMALALGGRWGRAEEGDVSVEADANSGEASEPEVFEPSEVIAESDPWTTD